MSTVTYVPAEKSLGEPAKVVLEVSLEDAGFLTAILGHTNTATDYRLYSGLADLADRGLIARLQPIEGYGAQGLFPSNKEHFEQKL